MTTWREQLEEARPALSGAPVILVHRESPAGSGLTACSGQSFTSPSDTDWPTVPRVLCVGCAWPHGNHKVVPRPHTTRHERGGRGT